MKKHLILITGASRGIGRSLALTFAKRRPPTSDVQQHFVLMGRTLSGLEETKSQLLNLSPQNSSHVDIHQVDLSDSNPSNPFSYTQTFSRLFTTSPSPSLPRNSVVRATLINNAASLGPILPFRQLLPSSSSSSSSSTSPSSCNEEKNLKMIRWIEREMNLNISSVVSLNSLFLNAFPSSPSSSSPKLEIVNLSSGAAWQAFPSMGLYCVHKAARKMLHETLALEEPAVRVLNYSPGVVNTLMHQQIRGEKSLEPEEGTGAEKYLDENAQICRMSELLLKEGQFVSEEMTTEELVKVLEEDTYTSGESIDFYQRKPELIPASLASPPPAVSS